MTPGDFGKTFVDERLRGLESMDSHFDASLRSSVSEMFPQRSPAVPAIPLCLFPPCVDIDKSGKGLMDLGDPDLRDAGDEIGVVLPSEVDSIVDYGEGTGVGIGR